MEQLRLLKISDEPLWKRQKEIYDMATSMRVCRNWDERDQFDNMRILLDRITEKLSNTDWLEQDVMRLLDPSCIINIVQDNALSMTADIFSAVLQCQLPQYIPAFNIYNPMFVQQKQVMGCMSDMVEDFKKVCRRVFSTYLTEAGEIPKFHGFIQQPLDFLLRRILGIRFDQRRDSKEIQADSKGRRPNVVMLIGNVPVFRAEEKKHENLEYSAKNQLAASQAKQQTFPILAATCAGSNVTFHIHWKGIPHPMSLIELSCPTIDVNSQDTCFDLLRYLINFSIYLNYCLIPALIRRNQSIEMGYKLNNYFEFKIREDRVLKTITKLKSGGSYQHDLDCIKRIYQHLEKANDHLLQIFYVRDHLEHNQRYLTVEMERLACPGYPMNSREFVAFCRSIIACLQLLHNNDYVHRDVRIANVRSHGESRNVDKIRKFALLDFECAKPVGKELEEKPLTSWHPIKDCKGAYPETYEIRHDVMMLRDMIFHQFHVLPFATMEIFLMETDSDGVKISALMKCETLDEITSLVNEYENTINSGL